MANEQKMGASSTPPSKSRRETALERLKARYPDKSFDDDESMYGQLLDDYDAGEQELNGYKDREKAFSDLFTSDPRSAKFLTDWKNGKKNRGCFKYITIPDDYRLSIDRDCVSFKKIYALRTEAERYNARFKQTGQERAWVHSFNAVQNLNTIAHIALLAIAVAATVTHSDYSVRCLKTVKRIA